MPKPTPSAILRSELQHKIRTLPVFLRPQLADVLGKLDDWIADVELRLARADSLSKMPTREQLDNLLGEESAGLLVRDASAL